MNNYKIKQYKVECYTFKKEERKLSIIDKKYLIKGTFDFCKGYIRRCIEIDRKNEEKTKKQYYISIIRE